MARFQQIDPLPESMPPPLPTAVVSHTRMESNNSRTTFDLLQPQSGSAMHMSSNDQYARATRGLGIGVVLQEDKLKQMAAREIKTQLHRQREEGVIASRLAEGLKAERVDEGRIRSKAQQLENYKQRLSQYKFTA